ncbi:MAG: vitamin B12-dependent ribonucleotide reductase [Acidobacteria bacterium]|nr:vitamin B12-dependent ribonucleotide reductase [Acidobacteriota bacterium]
MKTAGELSRSGSGKDGGLEVRRYFTIPGVDPFDQVEWENRTARIVGSDGVPVFEQPAVEFPKFWSQRATDIVAQKYFRGKVGTPERERSVRQMIRRVAETITHWGVTDGYFASQAHADTFRSELSHILLHQIASFNSPVWFNVGFEPKPQCSACFILSVEDDIDSILEWYRTEGKIFQGGSGSGINLSRLRSSQEFLSKGGKASGPVSFMRGADAIAGTIKSGGKTRRAAKMVVLNVDHPDIEEFVWCKSKEERKARALAGSGFDMSSLDADGWISIQYQNANNSVRVTDDFMKAAMEDGDWSLNAITTTEPVKQVRAKDLLRQIAQAAWECGDPGMQYDTTINAWHTCPNSGRINASNPCSEYMHLDDSACNLASINLMRTVDPSGEFNVEAFRHAVQIVILAQEIIVGNSSYPTSKIEGNAIDFRELGLGFANLGALLMMRGLPYDSDTGRAFAATITAMMTGEAYAESARIASRMGPFPGYTENRDGMLRVIQKHREHIEKIDSRLVPRELFQAAVESWDEALSLGHAYGYRNSQATVLAPTGTIAFMMDCDTTGIEPDIALVKYKKLVGGGQIRIVNQTVPAALARLGYTDQQVSAMMGHIEEKGTIEGAPFLNPDHLAVFDCAFRPVNGARSIHPMGHVRMMGAVQPFISGAISKTVNLPGEATVDEVAQTYIEGWRNGLKALAIYRDGSKATQPLSTGTASSSAEPADPAPARRRLPDTRNALTHHFTITSQDGMVHDGYITVGTYEDGSPGEIFVTVAKEGSTISGLMDAFATAISLAFQYGVPLEAMVKKFSHMRFEPSGVTTNPEIRVAKSIVDYIFRWLAARFLAGEALAQLGVMTPEVRSRLAAALESGDTVRYSAENKSSTFISQADAPACPDCGAIMVRNGSCYRCHNCGSTTGCS